MFRVQSFVRVFIDPGYFLVRLSEEVNAIGPSELRLGTRQSHVNLRPIRHMASKCRYLQR